MPDTKTTTVRDYRTHAEREVAERFPREVAEHKLTVLRDDGLYRHLRCAQLGSSFWWFEVVSWPGALAVRGDMGGAWVFSRIEDMFRFFRTHDGRINPGYWSEKLPDAGRSVRVHSESVLRDRLSEALAEYEQRYPELVSKHKRDEAGPWPAPPMQPAEVGELIADYDVDDRLRFGDGARDLLAELERAGVAEETYEWDLTDWDWPFLWACHAIVWAIREYDRQRAGGDRVAAGSGSGSADGPTPDGRPAATHNDTGDGDG